MILLNFTIAFSALLLMLKCVLNREDDYFGSVFGHAFICLKQMFPVI